MKIIPFALLTVLSAAAVAQTPLVYLHITAIHKATRVDEKTYHTAFNQNIITATSGDRRYTLEQLAIWGAYHFEVGHDYELISANDKTVKVRLYDKKGKPQTETVDVITVEEVPK